MADRHSRVVVAYRETGIDFVPSVELVARLEDRPHLNDPFDGPQGCGGIRPLMQDGADFESSEQLATWLRDRAALALGLKTKIEAAQARQ